MTGWIAIGCYATHASVLAFVRGEPWHALWLCHLSNILIGIGWLRRLPTLNAIGVCLLLIGTPLWINTVSQGDLELNPTSALTHVVGLAIGLVGITRLGWPTGSWWRAALVVAGLNLLSQAIVPFTPSSAHVNLAHGVWPGSMERYFTNKWLYLVVVWVVCIIVFLVAEGVARWLASRKTTRSPVAS
jgi:hypothetical protein